MHKLIQASHLIHNSLCTLFICEVERQNDSITWHFHALCFFVCSGISGPSPSQKKTSFHKIVRKHKHKKDKPGAVDKGELECFVPCKAGIFLSRVELTLQLYFGHLQNTCDVHRTGIFHV